MSCCCDGNCTTRQYEDDGTATWQAPGVDNSGSSRNDIAIDSSGNAYTVFGGVEKLNSSGTRVYVTANDFRFCRYTLNCICIDSTETYAFVGSQYKGGIDPFGNCDKNIFKVRLSDGEVVASTRIYSYDPLDNYQGNPGGVLDCFPDGDGGVFVATIGTSSATLFMGSFYPANNGIHHFDSDLNLVDSFGCNTTVLRITGDESGNIYSVGRECTTELENGCDVEWSVRKYDSSGNLVGGIALNRPSAIHWYNGFIYVGYRALRQESPCNIIKLDDTTFECEWTFRLGDLSNPYDGDDPATYDATGTVRDVLANADGVYVTHGKYLFQLSDADGSKVWCRKNEGVESDMVTLRDGYSFRIAATESDGETAGNVWVIGRSTPCNDAEEDACESGSCADDVCTCECGEIGRTGGTIVNCDCEEVPCDFTSDVVSDCENLGSSIHWTRHTFDKQTWVGTLSYTCSGTNFIVFTVTHDCEQEENDGWTITASGMTVSNLTIVETWCTAGAPGDVPFPGFRFTFDFDSGCDDCSGCSQFGEGDGGCGVDVCGCTNVPRTLYASLTGDYVGTVALVWNGTLFRGSFTDSGCTVTIDLACNDAGTNSFTASTGGTGGGSCSDCGGAVDTQVATCSPFYWSGSLNWSAGCPVGATGVGVIITE